MRRPLLPLALLAALGAIAGCGSSDKPVVAAAPTVTVTPDPPPDDPCGASRRERALLVAARAAGRIAGPELDLEHPTAEFKSTPAAANPQAKEVSANEVMAVWIVTFPKHQLSSKDRAPTPSDPSQGMPGMLPPNAKGFVVWVYPDGRTRPIGPTF